MRHISEHGADYFDQSAINYVLHNKIKPLDQKFNCVTNERKNWPSLRKPNSGNGTLMHFVGGPKPWHFLGRWIHPVGGLWWKKFYETAAAQQPKSEVPRGCAARLGGDFYNYKQTLKDRLLLTLYEFGWIVPKAVPKQS